MNDDWDILKCSVCVCVYWLGQYGIIISKQQVLPPVTKTDSTYMNSDTADGVCLLMSDTMLLLPVPYPLHMKQGEW